MNYFRVSCVVHILYSIFSNTASLKATTYRGNSDFPSSPQICSKDKLINLEYLVFATAVENYRILLWSAWENQHAFEKWTSLEARSFYIDICG